LKEAPKLACVNNRKGKETQKKYHDRKEKSVELKKGQSVYRNEMVKKAKLKEKLRGPYKELNKISEHIYKIEECNKKPITVNTEELKLCRSMKEEIRRQTI
jgi:hypothetical protein